MTIKIKTFEALEKYSDCLIQLIDMLVSQFKDHQVELPSENQNLSTPEVTEYNQFQMLHLFALFNLISKKQKLTEFIQENLSPKTLFNYLLCISNYIQAGLQDAYLEEIKF